MEKFLDPIFLRDKQTNQLKTRLRSEVGSKVMHIKFIFGDSAHHLVNQ